VAVETVIYNKVGGLFELQVPNSLSVENLVFDGVESMLRRSSSMAESETKVCSFNNDMAQV
jgi:hypothetical protein